MDESFCDGAEVQGEEDSDDCDYAQQLYQRHTVFSFARFSHTSNLTGEGEERHGG